MIQKNVIDCLRQRGFIDAMTSEEIRERAEKPMRVYIGFDPTADSLHLGNLVGIILLGWFQKFGHTPVVVLGGATGRIGDPSGKSLERPLLDDTTIRHNIKCIGRQFEQVLRKEPLMFNNEDWFKNYSYIDFLRDVGKHFRVGAMLAKESVRSRLDSDEGMSYTEFSYQLLQGYDSYYLFNEHDVCMQMGGSDQWGNITAGIELIRKLTGKSAYGLTFPLLLRSDGKKFGKSEEGAVWLSGEKFSPYKFYQYLLGIPDADVGKLMRMLTYMEMDEIAVYETTLSTEPNKAQRRLAEELTLLVHGEDGLQAALRVTEGVGPGSDAVLDAETFKEIEADMPHVTLAEAEVVGQKYVDLVAKIGFLPSKAEAVRLIKNGGAYLNNKKISDLQTALTKEDLVGGEYLLLAMGKKKKILIKIT